VKILGIDPGLQICGYACLQAGPAATTILEAGILRTNPDASLQQRLNQIAVDIRTVLQNLQPDTVAVEQLYSHYAHPRTAILMGHARGVILQTCARENLPVKSFSATRIKKATTGNGRASKRQIQHAIQTLMALPQLPQPDDVADAIAVALCCANEIQKTALVNGANV